MNDILYSDIRTRSDWVEIELLVREIGSFLLQERIGVK